VLEHGGTLIDYTGDGLCALWGAPEAQDDQARRACRAAVAMVEGLGPLNAAGLIRRPTELRIGLNTGLVRAGNIGSERFKKFGAHGMAINLGRRIESAGRYFRCPILLGQQTLDRLQDRNQAGEFAIRRLARIMVAGAQDPLNVYQLAVDPRGDVAAWQQTYENALQQFEHGTIDDVKQAGYDLSAWRKDNDWDQPSLVLLGRIINAALDGKLNDQAKVVRFTKEG
jgi:adenylate cyclase